MSIRNIVAKGIGFSPSSIKFIVTHGFGIRTFYWVGQQASGGTWLANAAASTDWSGQSSASGAWISQQETSEAQ